MAINEILKQHRAERDDIGEKLMQALSDNMPWGLEVDLGDGRKAVLSSLGGSQPSHQDGNWRILFDWQLENCDQDHIEVKAVICGGGGGA